MYSIGQIVYDKIKKQTVQVLEVEELWGYVTCKVFCADQNVSYTINAENLTIQANSENAIAKARYLAQLSKIRNEVADNFVASIDQNVVPLPHQLYALYKAISDNKIRYLLADEVGLGKTIEAGLIIKELKERGLIKRVLVVCPKGLVTQWQDEMKSKFNMEFNYILSEDYGTVARFYDKKNVFECFDNVIVPLDSIKPLEKRAGWDEDKIKKYNDERINAIVNSCFDLIIIDEAHRVAGVTAQVARYKLGNTLSKASPYLLLLTATPHSGKSEPFLRLVRLLDEDAFPNTQAVVREQVMPYLIRSEKRTAVDNDGNLLFKERITKLLEIKWEPKHSIQQELYVAVSRYIVESYNKAIRKSDFGVILLLIIIQRLVSSSTAAIKSYLTNRLVYLEGDELLSHVDVEDDDSELETEDLLDKLSKLKITETKAEIAEVKSLLALAKQAELQYIDAKAENMLEIVEKLYAEDRNTKLVIFTEFKATQKYLSQLLKETGFKNSILNGSMSIDERNITISDFKNETNILISTDAGGEGINLQFAHTMINYDLPWNPMKIEQRIGRIDRIGQKYNVLAFNYILADTVENRVRQKLELKLGLIMKQLGFDKYEDVLDNELAEVDFSDVYIKCISNPKRADDYINELEKSIKQQLEQADRIKDLLNAERDDVRKFTNIQIEDINRAVRNMFVNYKTAKGLDISLIDYAETTLANPMISKIVKQDIEKAICELPDAIKFLSLGSNKGWFSMWELSLGDTLKNKKVFYYFIDDNAEARPMVAQRIFDELCRDSCSAEKTSKTKNYSELSDFVAETAKSMAYNLFMIMKEEIDKQNSREYKRYIYANKIKIEAAQRIGIENIRKRRLDVLFEERERIEQAFEIKKKISPLLKPIMILRVE